MEWNGGFHPEDWTEIRSYVESALDVKYVGHEDEVIKYLESVRRKNM